MKVQHLFMSLSILALSLMNHSCKGDITQPNTYGVLPTEHQLAWQELEYYMFIHFGPNTFTDVEWGDGRESPKVFDPTDLDTDQWASVAKDAGMKGIIITAKHHDGFCLWPSSMSTHTVRESPWKDGKGDVLRDLSESCKKYGLKFGVYLSPWDQNHPAYGTSEYNKVFALTLQEVLSNYGEVFEQWFDGATDGTSNQVYDWDQFHKVVYENQPQAIIFSDIGPGCRWIGNERGIAGETNWSRMNVKGFGPGKDAPSTSILNEGEAHGEAWVPGEVDVSIRPGWFYSPSTDEKVKSVEHLMDIYYSSVGRNANLLLNVPPDRRGRIHPNDSTRLMAFRDAREAAHKTNLTKSISAKASNTRGNAVEYALSNLFNGNRNTYWTTDDSVKTASIEISFESEQMFNRLLLQEHIALGQRVAKFNVEVLDTDSNQWIEVSNGTTIGYKRILRFPQVSAKKLRVNITESLAEPILDNLEVYNDPEQYKDPFYFNGTTKMRLVDGKSSKEEDKTIYFDKKVNGITIALDKEYTIKGFTFTPDASMKYAAIQRYDLFVSSDLKNWKPIQINAIFNNIKNNPIPQKVIFEKPVKGSYLKLEPTQLTDNDADTYSYSSVDIITE